MKSRIHPPVSALSPTVPPPRIRAVAITSWTRLWKSRRRQNNSRLLKTFAWPFRASQENHVWHRDIEGSSEGAPAYLCLKFKKLTKQRRLHMDPIGFAAVVLAFAVPLAAIYAWYRVRKLRTEERLAAIAKGVSVPIAEELPPHARSRKAAILLIAGGLGYTLTFMWLSRFEADAMQAAVFGIIPISIGIGYFIDAVLVQREMRPAA